jgi:hypothetical protein
MAIVVLETVVSVIAGAQLAIWKFRVLSLVPTVTFLVLSAILIGIVERAGPGTIALRAIAVIVAPQLSYLATAFFADLIPWPVTALHARPVADPQHAARRVTVRVSNGRL